MGLRFLNEKCVKGYVYFSIRLAFKRSRTCQHEGYIQQIVVSESTVSDRVPVGLAIQEENDNVEKVAFIELTRESRCSCKFRPSLHSQIEQVIDV